MRCIPKVKNCKPRVHCVGTKFSQHNKRILWFLVYHLTPFSGNLAYAINLQWVLPSIWWPPLNSSITDDHPCTSQTTPRMTTMGDYLLACFMPPFWHMKSEEDRRLRGYTLTQLIWTDDDCNKPKGHVTFPQAFLELNWWPLNPRSFLIPSSRQPHKHIRWRINPKKVRRS